MPFKKSYLSSLIVISMSLLTFSCATNYDKPLKESIQSRTVAEQARDTSRHPFETLKFFQVEPGMKVAEALPGGGWYSKILANYLGTEGSLHGINYDDDMWPRFGFFGPEAIKQAIARTKAFPNQVATFTDNGIYSEGFTFSSMPSSLAGTLDHVLVIRALHNLNRFEKDASTRSTALATIHKLLKEDGLVGVVQHRAPESADDNWANGSRGYLKQSAVQAMFEEAGFELVSTSEINANPKDQPSTKDIVWRLPPTLNGSKDNPELKKAMLAIGESDRMTLLFRKK